MVGKVGEGLEWLDVGLGRLLDSLHARGHVLSWHF